MASLLEDLFHRPLILLLVAFAILSLSTWLGLRLLKRLGARAEELHEDLQVVATATLTLLALIVGFSFSMAVSRYDQRKNLEEAEANAIGTEIVRADLIAGPDGARVRTLLIGYLDERIRFYTARDDREVDEINARTARLQDSLWNSVRAPASAQPTPIMAVVVMGMNDVLNSQSYTQAAWLNQIPVGAWILMLVIAVGAATLVGVGAKSAMALSRMILVLPMVLSIAFFLISDLDSPRHGMIAVAPRNLVLLADSLRPRPEAPPSR